MWFIREIRGQVTARRAGESPQQRCAPWPWRGVCRRRWQTGPAWPATLPDRAVGRIPSRARRVRCWPTFPAAPALHSTRSAASCPVLFAGFITTRARSDFSKPCIWPPMRRSRTLRQTFRGLSTKSTTRRGCTLRSTISAPRKSRINTPSRGSKPPLDSVHPQGRTRKRGSALKGT